MNDLLEKKDRNKTLKQGIENCKKCNLWKTRDNPVIGEGSLDAEVLFIGEAPGYWEDKKGRPFVGRAGKILDELLEDISLKRDEVYIANILKCRPPSNRNPLPSEIAACTTYLDRQIEIINPKIIATLGNFSTKYILEKYGLKSERIGKTHGKVFHVANLLGKTKIIPLYHPAAATYNPNMKNVLAEDFKKIKREING